MKVICKSLMMPSYKDFLTIGNEYLVLEILVADGKCQYRITPDGGGTPITFDISQFMISDNSIPRNWSISYTENNELWIAPSIWLDDDMWQYSFWEDFCDGSEKAERIYKEEVQKMINGI